MQMNRKIGNRILDSAYNTESGDKNTSDMSKRAHECMHLPRESDVFFFVHKTHRMERKTFDAYGKGSAHARRLCKMGLLRCKSKHA